MVGVQQDEGRAGADHGEDGVDDGAEHERARDVFLEQEQHRLEEHPHRHLLRPRPLACLVGWCGNPLFPPRSCLAVQRFVFESGQWYGAVAGDQSQRLRKECDDEDDNEAAKDHECPKDRGKAKCSG